MTDELDPRGVAAFRSTRQPSSTTQASICPACGNKQPWTRHYEYVEVSSARGLNGDRSRRMSYSGTPDPHLEVTCACCGFWWEEEVCVP